LRIQGTILGEHLTTLCGWTGVNGES